MYKPVSEPTAPAEPAPALEQMAQFNYPMYVAMAKDAERYRWLRENWLARSIYDVDYGGFHQLKPYEQLDAAIDAAMKV